MNALCFFLLHVSVICLQRESMGDNTPSNGSCIGSLTIWICMQGIDLLFDGQGCICHKSCFQCFIEDGQCQVHLSGGI